jgi:FlaG/FlaF family flagellin (archaellin)
MGVRAVVASTVALGALVGGAYLGDRWAHSRAEDQFAQAVRTGVEGVTGDPVVHIAGFPFLTQLVAGSLDDVTIGLDSAAFSGVDLQDVDVRARGVTTSEPYRAQRAVVHGSVSTATLEALVAERTDADVDLAVDDGRLTATVEVMRGDVTAELVPAAQDGALVVDVVRVTLGGAVIDVEDLPRAVEGWLQDLTVPVERLPEGLGLTDVVVQGDGVRMTATGTDVVLPVLR